ncbi:hypothetical protein LCGC14_0918780 [marine sediment metagenome]|uniref:Uncharacterized protein n=1 Tax=marine sediment metagenome TaxID=412755 RepID=A0A0F9RA53_9ZZZZ
MAASYPGTIHTFTSVANQVDIVDAADVNDLQLEVTAIETELGVDVAGTFATVLLALAQSVGEKASAQSDLFYATAANAVSALAKGTSLQQLRMNAGATAPEWFTDAGGGGQAMKSLPASAWQSTSDVANWASAQAQVKQSSDTVPSPRWIEWLFDASTDEFIVIDFFVPDNYGSAPVLKVRYKCLSATSGTAAFQARLACITDADAADMDAKAFDTVNAGTATVPGTAGYVDEISITLTNADSMAADDHCIMALNRDVSADSVAADIEFVGAKFEYTSA